MTVEWSGVVRRFRARHGIAQKHLSDLVGVSQRTVSRWERGQDLPSLKHQKLLRDLCRTEDSGLLSALSKAISYSPVPRALSVMPDLSLVSVSPPAIQKRPSVQNMIGSPLARLACGILSEILDDRILQRGIARREILGLVTVTQGVLRTCEKPIRETFRTTISYFENDGVLYSDAVSTLGTSQERLGYWAITADEMVVPQ